MTAIINFPKQTVAEEVASGDVLTCPQIARRGPSTRQNKPLHPSTILRWILDGVKTLDGAKVRLEAVRLGGRWVTSAAAYQRFIALQTPPLMSSPILTSPTNSQRSQRAERAAAELGKAGI